MAKLAVHPHIGFLNTEFSIHIICEPEETFTNGNLVINRIETVDNSAESVISIERGNRTVSHKFDKAGIYSIRIEGQSESIQVEVKDAIRFGGGQHKANYIFDETPWCFILMEDRTYFYNRDTKEQYVESISPDVIQVVNKDVVLFKSNNKESSLYSLANHRIFANYTIGEIVENRWLVSEVETNGIKKLDIISFDIDEICCLQFEYQDYQIDAQRKGVYIINNDTVSALSLETMEILDSRTYNNERPLCFTDTHYYILQKRSSIFAVYDILGFCYVTNIQAENPVSSLCTKQLLCKDKIGELNLVLENAKKNLDSTYASCVQYRCSYIDKICIYNNNVYYKEQEEIAYINVYGAVKCKWMYHIKCGGSIIYSTARPIISSLSIVSGKGVCGKDSNGKTFYIDENNCLRYDKVQSRNYMRFADFAAKHPNQELKIEKTSKGTEYFILGKIVGYISPNALKMHHQGELDTNKLAYAEVHSEGDFVKDKNGKVIIDADNKPKENWYPCLLLLNSALISGDEPTRHSTQQSKAYSIKIKDGEVWLTRKLDDWGTYSEIILDSLYDNSSYSNVFLSDDGENIVYREKDNFILKSTSTGSESSFPNMEFITHTNGHRPLILLDSCRRPRMIDPITRQAINGHNLPKYKFISPDKKYYANTHQTIKYYHNLKGIYISESEYNAIKSEYPILYPSLDKKERQNIIEKREKLFNRYPAKLNQQFLESRDITDLIVAKHGFIEVINCVNDEVKTTIPLGTALWFLNYVSFSYDERYIAIAGRYPDGAMENGRCVGGLFLVYDLERDAVIKKVTDSNACWRTAFTKSNKVVSYSSDPHTYIFDSSKNDTNKGLSTIAGRNFLAVSPDDKYIALSNQGYIRYNGGTYGKEWGHMPSTTVYIHSLDSIHHQVIPEINDLATNIKDVNQASTTTSCSFSLDNKKLMMVGNDGVVVIRNLNLD